MRGYLEAHGFGPFSARRKYYKQQLKLTIEL
jgi:hypothetical protein